MADTILVFYVPLQFVTSANCFNLLFTAPFGLISNYIVIMKSYSNIGGNLDCFKGADPQWHVAELHFIKSTIMMLAALFAWHRGTHK